MNVVGLALALSLTPAVAADPPTFWHCLGESRMECRGPDCAPGAVTEVVLVSLLTWTYERCAEVCISGTSTSWVEDASGSVIVIANDYPQHLILGPANTFTDVATAGDTTTITRGRCFPALKDQATTLSLLDVYHERRAQDAEGALPSDGPLRP